jgi:hypothetical protein
LTLKAKTAIVTVAGDGIGAYILSRPEKIWLHEVRAEY